MLADALLEKDVAKKLQDEIVKSASCLFAL